VVALPAISGLSNIEHTPKAVSEASQNSISYPFNKDKLLAAKEKRRPQEDFPKSDSV
jgi:hypothetical protein